MYTTTLKYLPGINFYHAKATQTIVWPSNINHLEGGRNLYCMAGPCLNLHKQIIEPPFCAVYSNITGLVVITRREITWNDRTLYTILKSTSMSKYRGEYITESFLQS